MVKYLNCFESYKAIRKGYDIKCLDTNTIYKSNDLKDVGKMLVTTLVFGSLDAFKYCIVGKLKK